MDTPEGMPFTLAAWWRGTSDRDYTETVPKMEEYGADGRDMVEIGRTLAQFSGISPQDGIDPDAFYGNLGVWFYQVGKIARIGEDLRAGRLPKYDSLFDQTIYSLIARRFSEFGQWGGEQK